VPSATSNPLSELATALEKVKIDQPTIIPSKFIDSNYQLLLDDLLAYNRSCRQPGIKETLVPINKLAIHPVGWTDLTLPDRGLLIGEKFSIKAKTRIFTIEELTKSTSCLFFSTITQKSLFEECPGVVLAGGFLANKITGVSRSSDIDLFLVQETNDEEKLRNLANQIIAWINRNHQVKDTFTTRNAITIIDQHNHEWQIILRLYQTPDEILWGFDMACCQLLYDGVNLYTTEPGLIAFQYNISLVEPETWYYCYESRLNKYAKRGFFFYFWFVQEPWQIGLPSSSACLLDRVTGEHRFYGVGDGVRVDLPYLTLVGLTPVQVIDPVEFELIKSRDNILRSMKTNLSQIFHEQNSLRVLKRDGHQARFTTKVTTISDLNKRIADLTNDRINMANVLNKLEENPIKIRLQSTRVALATFSERDFSGSTPLNCELLGKKGKIKYHNQGLSTGQIHSINQSNPNDSDYQQGSIDYHRPISITWNNLRALDRLSRGFPAYPIGKLNEECIKEVPIMLDWNYLIDWLLKWLDPQERTVDPTRTNFHLKLVLGESGAEKFIKSFGIGGIKWCRNELLKTFYQHMGHMAPFLNISIKFQTINSGTVLSGKNDPGRGKTLEEWAGGWLRINNMSQVIKTSF